MSFGRTFRLDKPVVLQKLWLLALLQSRKIENSDIFHLELSKNASPTIFSSSVF